MYNGSYIASFDELFADEEIREYVKEVAIDYLSVGIDPNKVNIFIQSEVSELTELTFYYMNLVTVSRLQRNPTVKSEIKQKDFNTSLPVGFMCYPISQAADITAFKANIIPVGDDQLPMIEQTNEIVRSFNRIYGDTLVECKAVLPEKEIQRRLPGLDGNNKMSKSLGNCIYLCDDSETVYKKVMSMYTDPNHIKVDEPGNVEGNMVFTYLDAFSSDELIKKYSEFETLEEMKNKYSKGGLGDVKIKKVLYSVIEEILTPIREKRKYYLRKSVVEVGLFFTGVLLYCLLEGREVYRCREKKFYVIGGVQNAKSIFTTMGVYSGRRTKSIRRSCLCIRFP